MGSEMQGKHAFLQTLRAEGVRYIFGNPGTSEGPMIGVLHEYPDLEYLMVVQEGVAVGMAEGYARATGEVGFVSLHIDNGLANGFGLMIDQKRTGTPVVITAGNKDIRSMAAGRSDLADMAAPFAKWSTEITHAEQIPSVMRRAFQEARTPPTGPVFVAVSLNAFDDWAEMDISPSQAIYSEPLPDPAAIDEAASLLATAKNPLMVVGDRVYTTGGVNATAELADTIGAPVYGHTGGNINFPPHHNMWCGSLALRSRETINIVKDADVILAIGCPVFEDFFYQSGNYVSPETKLIHIDINAGEIGKKEPTDIGILASPREAMQSLNHAIRSSRREGADPDVESRTREIADQNLAKAAAFEELAASSWDNSPVTPAALGKALADAIPQGASVFNDSISSQTMVNAGIAHRKDLNVIAARGGAIGWGMGGTMGLKLANPDRPAIGIVGDGSAMMTVQGLWTAVNYGIPITYVICNNAMYRVLKVNMNFYHEFNDLPPPEVYTAMDFPTPFDFKAQAQAYGAFGIRVERAKDIKPAINEAVESGVPAVVDVILDGAL